MEALGKGLALVLAALVLVAVATAVDTVVVHALWGWFVAPTFRVATPSMAATAGIVLIVGQLTTNARSRKKDDTDWVQTFLLRWVYAPVIALTLGYMLHRLA